MSYDINNLYNIIKNKYNNMEVELKTHLEKAGFLYYYFTERNKIKEWNDKLNIIQFGFLSFSLKLSTNFKTILDDLFSNNILDIFIHLSEIVNNGWRWRVLSIAEYNVIVLFTDFSNKFAAVTKRRTLGFKEFIMMEEAFFKMTYHPKYPELLLQGLNKILLHYAGTFFKNNPQKINQIIYQLQYFFTPNYLSPSIFDLIQAFNIVYYKQYFDWNDLILLYENEIIQSDFYNCSKEVFDQLIITIMMIRNDNERIEDELKKINWIKDYFPKKSDNMEHAQVIDFYQSFGHDWIKDQQNILLLMILLIDGIHDRLKQLIVQEWTLLNHNESTITTRIFNHSIIDQIFTKFENEYKQIRENYNTLQPTPVTWEQLIDEANANLINFKSQFVIFEKIQNLFTNLKELARIMKQDYLDKSNQELKLEVVSFMVVTPDLWRGKIVLSIIDYYIHLFIQIYGFFNKKNLKLELELIQKLNEQFKNNCEKIKSFSDSQGIIETAIEKEIKKKNSEKKK